MSARRTAAWRRGIRKHRLALSLCGVALALLFLPSLLFGRILSPNDVIYQHWPWRWLFEGDAQNPILNDAPSSWLAHWSLMKDDPSSFHWIPYVGGGLPGWGSVGGAVLSPVILIPVFVLPLVLSYTGIVVAKLLTALWLAYGWLREERLGRSPAAVGAAGFALAGIVSVWWLWQATNATVFYPALLWIVARAFRRKRTPFMALIAAALAIGLAGYPATTLYGIWVAVAYAGWLAIRERFVPWRELARLVAAAVLALAIAAPFIAPFASFLGRSGYLEGRAEVASAGTGTYPADHLFAFLDPYRLGDPAERRWAGDPALGVSNNFVESTLYVGVATLLLAAAGLFRGHRGRFFWIAVALLVLLVIFGASETLVALAGKVPGIRFSPVARLRYVLPIPAAFLAAAGTGALLMLARRSRRPAVPRIAAWIAGLAVTVELALFAVRFFPYIRPELASVPATPTIEFLRGAGQPSRVAPFFDYLWPNTAELMRVEDIRSHFGSEARWRALLERFAPGSFGGSGTVIQFNSLTFDYTDPLVAALNVRWLVEQPPIDILRWRIMSQSTISEPATGSIPLEPGLPVTVQLDVTDGMNAADVSIDAVDREAGGGVTVELVRPETGERLWMRRVPWAELRTSPKVYVPVARHAGGGNALLARIAAFGASAALPIGESGRVVYGRVASPVIVAAVLPDGRIFENLEALPRFFAVWRWRETSFDEMLRDRAIDFRTEVALTGGSPPALDAIAAVPPADRRARFRIVERTSSRTRIRVESAVPFLMVSSEKITPELRVRVDGDVVQPLEANGMFAALPIEPGEHVVELERRIGRGLWPLAALGIAGLVACTVLDLRSSRPTR